MPSDITAAFGGLTAAEEAVARAKAAEAEAEAQLRQFLAGHTLEQLEREAQTATADLLAAIRAVSCWRAVLTLA